MHENEAWKLLRIVLFTVSFVSKSLPKIVTLHSLRLALSRPLGLHTTEIILIFKKRRCIVLPNDQNIKVKQKWSNSCLLKIHAKT